MPALDDNSVVAQLEAANLHPLWDRFQRSRRSSRKPQDAPLIWRWNDIEPFAERAVAEVAIDDVERRALILVNPAFGGETVTTSNLIAAFTVLDPGDRARPHRHTFAAIRFATRAEGAATIVNGRRCDMHDGDLILTPPMCWHGHINESDHRIIWFDAANIPLIRQLDANFFEPGDPKANQFWQVDEGDEKLWAESGTGRRRPAARAGAFAEIPLFRRSDPAAARRAARRPRWRAHHPLHQSGDRRRGDAGARLLRDAACRKDDRRGRKRTTCNMICLVVSGSGRSHDRRADVRLVAARRVHDPALDLGAATRRNDGDADLFIVSDKSAFERLDLLREELQ